MEKKNLNAIRSDHGKIVEVIHNNAFEYSVFAVCDVLKNPAVIKLNLREKEEYASQEQELIHVWLNRIMLKN